MRKMIVSSEMDMNRFPVENWRLVEKKFSKNDYGKTETLFTVGNGYLGMRANPEEGREADSHGTFINGFHETWQIRHAEEAYGLAKIGQTIVNVPDAKLIKLYVDDEPLLLANADLDNYERAIDFKTGILTRNLVWRTPAGARIKVQSTRMASFVHRHLAMMVFEVEPLDETATIVISSQLLNRQDGEDEYYVSTAALGEGRDPRRSTHFDHRVFIPIIQKKEQETAILGYRCANSKMTIACSYTHILDCPVEYKVDTAIGPNIAKTVIKAKLEKGQRLKLVKFAAYHTSTGVPPEELADRCRRTLEAAVETGASGLVDSQTNWLTDFWEKSDITIEGSERDQQAVRWNLFQLAQATGRSQENGIPAKGVTSAAYDGHYFWDTEIYIIPFLACTHPEKARKLLRFRWQMLPAAKKRAEELDQKGALYPWRTINGHEASAYYAAGTAQYHINAAIAYAVKKYVDISGDTAFLYKEGAEILIETARAWEDLGFFSETKNGVEFHIHRVTGPDEYTTVVNDNFYTNVMARFNLLYAVQVVNKIGKSDPNSFRELVKTTGLTEEEVAAWSKAAACMFIPYNSEKGIHPQDINFLDLEPWDFTKTPPHKYPLLLHYHPLTIYRHQVLKQADVVLVHYLLSEHFPKEQKKRDFDFYDPITTGDSSLSACIQSIVASEIGYSNMAKEYFDRALYLDLLDFHSNTADGVHVASTAGVWASIIHGFAGLSIVDGKINLSPRLPTCWKKITFNILLKGERHRIEIDSSSYTINGKRTTI